VIAFAENLGAKRDPLLDRSRRLDFSGETRMSGVDLPDGRVADAVCMSAGSITPASSGSAVSSAPRSPNRRSNKFLLVGERRGHILPKPRRLWRPVQRTGRIMSHPLLGGLHHHYVRI